MSFRNAHVKRVGELQVATSLVYGNYQHTKHLAEKIQIVAAAIPVLRKLLKVNPNLEIVMRPIKSKITKGYYLHTRNGTIEVDPRKSDVGEVLATLCHEFVHAEQYFTGKMDHRNGIRYWEGQPFRTVTPTMNADAYRDQPWEKEAFERMHPLADQVMNVLMGVDPAKMAAIIVNSVVDPDSELREEVYEELLKQGKTEQVARRLADNDTLNQAKKIGLI